MYTVYKYNMSVIKVFLLFCFKWSFQVPIFIPILALMASVFLVLAPIVDKPQIEYLYATIFILSGTLIYIPFIHFKLCPYLLEKVTVLLQLFLEVAPAEKNMWNTKANLETEIFSILLLLFFFIFITSKWGLMYI